MKSINYCCSPLEYAIKDGNIIHREDKSKFYIYGYPSFADDGDGYTDDMTETTEITHCPFCGRKLCK